jgi:hypothetical protein
MSEVKEIKPKTKSGWLTTIKKIWLIVYGKEITEEEITIALNKELQFVPGQIKEFGRKIDTTRNMKDLLRDLVISRDELNELVVTKVVDGSLPVASSSVDQQWRVLVNEKQIVINKLLQRIENLETSIQNLEISTENLEMKIGDYEDAFDNFNSTFNSLRVG